MDLGKVACIGEGGRRGREEAEVREAEKPNGVKYWECRRNHAAALGLQALDGCAEFWPATLDALKCAACACHRNFHLRGSRDGGCVHGANPNRNPLFQSSTTKPLPPPPQQASPPPEGSPWPEEERGQGRKRPRTKFTREQKEKMQEFAERLGWRVQGRDGEDFREFCDKVGVKQRVLKVWIHNNKTALSGAGAGAEVDPDPAPRV